MKSVEVTREYLRAVDGGQFTDEFQVVLEEVRFEPANDEGDWQGMPIQAHPKNFALVEVSWTVDLIAEGLFKAFGPG